MHRIDVPSATVDNKFTEGSPTGGIPATTVAADWLNDLQENVCKAVEGAGLTLDKGNYDQLKLAIQAMALTYLPKRVFASSDFIRIPDVAGGLIIQFGLSGTISPASTLDVSLPTTFPNAIRGAVVSHASAVTSRVSPLGVTLSNTSTIKIANSDTTATSAYYLAWGY